MRAISLPAPVRQIRTFSHWVSLIRVWLAWRTEYRALRDLDDHLLRDLGITRDEAIRTASRPFWSR